MNIVYSPLKKITPFVCLLSQRPWVWRLCLQIIFSGLLTFDSKKDAGHKNPRLSEFWESQIIWNWRHLSCDLLLCNACMDEGLVRNLNRPKSNFIRRWDRGKLKPGHTYYSVDIAVGWQCVKFTTGSDTLSPQTAIPRRYQQEKSLMSSLNFPSR